MEPKNTANVTTQHLGTKFLFLLAAIGALGSMAIHMLVPALPTIAVDLGFSEARGQFAISLYLMALGVGQIFGGARSDRMGRKPVLLVALILFCVGSIFCALSPNASAFLVSRFVQGLGGGAAIVVARTIISDLSKSEDIARKVAGFTTVLLMSPALSPLFGGVMDEIFGWRIIFWVLCALSAFICVMFFMRFTESRSTEGREYQKGGFLIVLKNKTFLRFTAPIALATSAMYLFLSASPFLLINEYGLSATKAGLCYLLVAASCIIATRFVGRIEKNIGAFWPGFLLMTVAGAAMAVLGLFNLGGIWALILPMSVIGFGAGLSSPSGFAGVLRSVPGLEGTSSSLAGAVQMLCAGLVSSIGSYFGMVSYLPLVVTILILCLAGLCIAPRGNIHQLTKSNSPKI